MAASSAYMTRAPTQVVDRPPAQTGPRLVPGAPKLVMLAGVVLVGVSVEANVLLGPAAWLVGIGMAAAVPWPARTTNTARSAPVEPALAHG
jgi:hypothetical protein